MATVLIASEPAPPLQRGLAIPLLALIGRSATMGLLAGPPVTALDAASVRRLLRALQQHGIGGTAAAALAPLTQPGAAPLDAEAERLAARGLRDLVEALEISAVPEAEWPAMRELLGDELLGALVGVAASSLRRYAAGERRTPDEVAARLHWVALVASDLAGAYNAYGIRRWFDRPRVQLEGRSPRALLGKRWSPDGEPAQRVRALAATLVGAQPLAA